MQKNKRNISQDLPKLHKTCVKVLQLRHLLSSSLMDLLYISEGAFSKEMFQLGENSTQSFLVENFGGKLLALKVLLDSQLSS